ncbi:hypothetical protein Tco_0589881, partial [Tanacetum coccineum]
MLWHQNSGAKPLPLNSGSMAFLVPFHEIIDVDMDEDPNDVVFIQGKAESTKKRKGAMVISLGSGSSVQSDSKKIKSNTKGKLDNLRIFGDTPTPPKPPIDKAYSIASIKACIPTPLDLDKLNYNSWSSLFQRFCKTYEVHHHLAAPSTTATSTVDPLHDTNDSLVVMWIYATISPKLVEMIVDVDSTAHGVWNRLKDLFHDNKDARITQLDNEIRNMAIGNLSIT